MWPKLDLFVSFCIVCSSPLSHVLITGIPPDSMTPDFKFICYVLRYVI